jgi:hypothetical protein
MPCARCLVLHPLLVVYTAILTLVLPEPYKFMNYIGHCFMSIRVLFCHGQDSERQEGWESDFRSRLDCGHRAKEPVIDLNR